MSEDRRPCPYCAESILPAAIKCPHCGSSLVKPAPVPDNNALTIAGTLLILGSCVACPLGVIGHSGETVTLSMIALPLGFVIFLTGRSQIRQAKKRAARR